MLVDSHCHLDFPDFAGGIPQLVARMAEAGVGWALCAGVTLERMPAVLEIARSYANIYAAAGVHPDVEDGAEPDEDTLVGLAADPKVVAIGETGLDYYRLQGEPDWQQRRFRIHIGAARRTRKPLIIHTRAAAADTLRILREEKADAVGGVFHCFTEDAATARQALDLGFMISFSGIVTFKNAVALKEVAAMVPLDRLLVETDAPYLAPTPHRGKLNEPAFVRHVAVEVARIKGLDFDVLAGATTDNFFRLFSTANPTHG
ncbi:MAG: TatD family hydrolase [Rhodocyclales bacterium]|nr:TatD family hydrolase [Rhodocyclales bacterium]